MSRQDDLLNELTHLARQQGHLIGYVEGYKRALKDAIDTMPKSMGRMVRLAVIKHLKALGEKV